MYNDRAAAGAEYVMLRIGVECKTDRCAPRFEVGLGLVDNDGKIWEEIGGLVVDDDLDDKEALDGYTIGGWQVFEYPEDEPIEMIAIIWGEDFQFSRVPTN